MLWAKLGQVSKGDNAGKLIMKFSVSHQKRYDGFNGTRGLIWWNIPLRWFEPATSTLPLNYQPRPFKLWLCPWMPAMSMSVHNATYLVITAKLGGSRQAPMKSATFSWRIMLRLVTSFQKSSVWDSLKLLYVWIITSPCHRPLWRRNITLHVGYDPWDVINSMLCAAS